jgi:hypothetical protein
LLFISFIMLIAVGPPQYVLSRRLVSHR